jgi:hypothetical protein
VNSNDPLVFAETRKRILGKSWWFHVYAGFVFSILLFRLCIWALAFLMSSPIVSLVGIAAANESANAFL